MLTGFCALDLTNEKGLLCGKILADLGADVIKIERPCGDAARSIGPFYHDICEPNKSLFWFAYNNNKRSITLNIESRDGQEIFKKLVQSADFVIESFAPGYMDDLGLGYESLSKINPGIILVSISPFGQAGPYKDYKASDIVLWAMGGMLYITGDPDRPPIQTSFPQSYFNGAVAAAAGGMVALYHRELTGEGQWVDTSIQQSIVCLLAATDKFWSLNKIIWRRTASERPDLGIFVRRIWRCRDGYVGTQILGGSPGAPSNQALVEWMDSEGIATELLKTIDWYAFDWVHVSEETADLIQEPMARFFLTHTITELYEGAMSRHILLYPVADIKHIVENPQLAARNFWIDVEHPELNTAITYPNVFVKASETALGINRKAPLIGEHNREVYCGELGLSEDELIILKQCNAI